MIFLSPPTFQTFSALSSLPVVRQAGQQPPTPLEHSSLVCMSPLLHSNCTWPVAATPLKASIIPSTPLLNLRVCHVAPTRASTCQQWQLLQPGQAHLCDAGVAQVDVSELLHQLANCRHGRICHLLVAVQVEVLKACARAWQDTAHTGNVIEDSLHCAHCRLLLDPGSSKGIAHMF